MPAELYVSRLRVRGDMTSLYITVSTEPAGTPAAVNATVLFGGSAVTTFAGDAGVEIVVPIPNPQLWHPDQPNLYDLFVSVSEPSNGGVSDTVGSYFGMRLVGTANFTAPPVPPSGPRIGWDNAGGDMPGQPTTLNASDYNLCWALCNSTPGCAAWSYGVPGAGCETKPLCWLKASVEGWSQNTCRVAGDMGLPGGLALRPTVSNGHSSRA